MQRNLSYLVRNHNQRGIFEILRNFKIEKTKKSACLFSLSLPIENRVEDEFEEFFFFFFVFLVCLVAAGVLKLTDPPWPVFDCRGLLFCPPGPWMSDYTCFVRVCKMEICLSIIGNW